MTFEKCRGKRKPLPFDFYLTELNTCIEYDGKQYFLKESLFYSDQTKINDQTKNLFCKDNNIKLIRISYKDNIISILEQSQISTEVP